MEMMKKVVREGCEMIAQNPSLRMPCWEVKGW